MGIRKASKWSWGLVALSALVVGAGPVGCGDDDDDGASGAGGGTSGGKAGSVSSGGNAGVGNGGAGSAGGPGVGGGAGNAGAGGDAGSAGSAGGGAPPSVTQVVGGGAHTCALFDRGEVSCWGQNNVGQLGDGTTENRSAPVAVASAAGGPALGDVKALALSQSTCALLGSGELRCWGRNDKGQLGDGTTENRPSPAPVLVAAGGAPLGDVRAVGVGRAHACALVSGGELRCWGFNSDGQLGDGTAATRPAPVPVLVAAGGAPLAGVQAVSVGAVHTCAVVEGGQVRCWGDNSSGQIGDDSTTDRPSPVTVVSEPGGDPLAGVQTVEVGSHHSCALLTGGELRCWGQNNFGQLGDGTEGDRLTPTPVVSEAGGAPLTGVQAVSVGDEHTCALLAGGELRCWGRNDDGRLGNGVTAAEATSVPVPVLKADGAPFAGVRGVAAADKHTCALLDGVDVQCWGANGLGQLGDGTTTDRIKPAPVTFP